MPCLQRGIEFTWKSAFQEIKKSKVKYRFLLKDYVQNAVFSKFYKQMKINVH